MSPTTKFLLWFVFLVLFFFGGLATMDYGQTHGSEPAKFFGLLLSALGPLVGLGMMFNVPGTVD